MFVINADLDHDGGVSLSEAHVYALRSAVSYDLPRSSSEMYLERWCPWYLRWFSFAGTTDNLYHTIAVDIAAKNNFLINGQINMGGILTNREKLYRELKQAEAEERIAKEKSTNLQKDIQTDLKIKYPEIMKPYTYSFHRLMNTKKDEVLQFIVQHPKYESLSRMQNEEDQLHDDITGLKRKIITMDKIVRMRTLSRLKSMFQKLASDMEKAEYQRLLNLEQQSF